MLDNINIVSVIGYIIGVAGALVMVFSKTKNDNLSDLKDRVIILEAEREEARKAHLDNQKAISNLEGQLATYKEIPLKSIAESLEKLTISNETIVETLQGSAKLAKDAQTSGGLLVKTDKKPLDVKVKK